MTDLHMIAEQLDQALADLRAGKGDPLSAIEMIADEIRKATFTLLVIEHKHGDNMSLWDSEASAKTALAGYVHDWWAQEMGDEPEPENPDEAIDAYFEKVNDEFWTITNDLDAQRAG